MNKNCETISDSNGIELLASYYFENPTSQIEFGDEAGCMVYTELVSVELVIAGRGINILGLLNENEKEHIIGKLSYE